MCFCVWCFGTVGWHQEGHPAHRNNCIAMCRGKFGGVWRIWHKLYCCGDRVTLGCWDKEPRVILVDFLVILWAEYKTSVVCTTCFVWYLFFAGKGSSRWAARRPHSFLARREHDSGVVTMLWLVNWTNAPTIY